MIGVQGTFKVTCPDTDCRAELDYGDIKRRAKDTVFTYYDKQLTRQMLRTLPDFRWCKNAQCGSGQETVDGDKHPIVTCHGCKTRSCFIHDVPWHANLTCAEYTTKVQSVEDAANQQYYDANTKPCPNCNQHIEKNEGCDHMTCKKPLGCGSEFCWRCLASYDKIMQHGNHHHQPTCTYYAPYDGTDD